MSIWFKQAQIFQLSHPIEYDADNLAEQLKPYNYLPCLPSFAQSLGWTPPIGDDEDSPLVHAANGYLMLALRIEDKLLPATVVRQAMIEKIKKREKDEDRRLGRKEKLSIQDEVRQTLLPRAFSKFADVFAIIDCKRSQLILNTTNAKRTESFLEWFKKSVSSTALTQFKLRKISHLLSQWVIHNDYPQSFNVEKNATLQDPEQQNRVIRAQQQDLFADSMQALLKDGCHVTQLGLTWHDNLSFVITQDLHVRSIKYQEELLESAKDQYTETEAERIDADFTIVTETLSHLFNDLLECFVDTKAESEEVAAEEELLLA